MTEDLLMAKGEAMQDQEIAAGVEWVNSMHMSVVLKFFDQLNDATPVSIRKLGDAQLQVIRSMAMIGFFEVTKSHANKEQHGK